jgi:hypothetical protein
VENPSKMARVCSTARVTHEGEEA